jgi:hypothetical protein
MGIVRYDSNYSAPAKEQRERSMRGDYEEHTFGNNREILLVLYNEARTSRTKLTVHETSSPAWRRIIRFWMMCDGCLMSTGEGEGPAPVPDLRGTGNNRGSLLHTP